MDIIGIGASNVDLLYKIDSFEKFNERLKGVGQEQFRAGGEDFGKPEELTKLLNLLEHEGESIGQSGGGSAANTIVACSRLGLKAGYVGKVGNDIWGHYLIESLRKEGVDISKIVIDKYMSSGMCIAVSDDKERGLRVFPNANDKLNKNDIDLDYVSDSKFIHMTSFACSFGEEPLQAQIYVAQNAKARISFDPGELYCKKGFGEMLPILERTYILFMSEEEMEMWGFDYENCSRVLLEYGPQIVACKRGEKGCYVIKKKEKTKKEKYEVYKVPVEEIVEGEATGRGDVFDAGFLTGLFYGYEKDLRRCARFANYLAGKSMTKPGRGAYPTREDLDYFKA